MKRTRDWSHDDSCCRLGLSVDYYRRLTEPATRAKWECHRELKPFEHMLRGQATENSTP